MSKSTLTQRVTALETGMSALLAHFGIDEVADTTTAQVTPAKAEPKAEPFVEYLRETAEARAQRKAFNADLSAWLKSKNLPIGGSVWAEAKKGERGVRKLRALAKADAAARKAA